MAEQSGPGTVSLDRFVAARLDETDGPVDHQDWCAAHLMPDQPCHCPRERILRTRRAHRQIVDAHSASESPVHRAGIGVAVRALAEVWAEHPDYDPTWRL